jgi:hypothetical protein
MTRNWSGGMDGERIRGRRDIRASRVAAELEALQGAPHHRSIDKKSRQVKKLGRIFIEKVYQVFRNSPYRRL